MLFSEMAKEVRLAAIEDAELGLKMPELTIAGVARGERISPASLRTLTTIYTQTWETRTAELMVTKAFAKSAVDSDCIA